ncbi:hypothetical protein HK099_001315 [Clydaea vesicula]|uniref:EDR1/CTR1/ARMC3-like peptidase-like domain-containing protein n=1 Tax=Clydaea vesicula TaxID=447962 RepID=A0AAD5XX58_9FUNG|nr:hypothetical protein HK099_001315 [Clydaea vesicula]
MLSADEQLTTTTSSWINNSIFNALGSISGRFGPSNWNKSDSNNWIKSEQTLGQSHSSPNKLTSVKPVLEKIKNNTIPSEKGECSTLQGLSIAKDVKRFCCEAKGKIIGEGFKDEHILDRHFTHFRDIHGFVEFSQTTSQTAFHCCFLCDPESWIFDGSQYDSYLSCLYAEKDGCIPSSVVTKLPKFIIPWRYQNRRTGAISWKIFHYHKEKINGAENETIVVNPYKDHKLRAVMEYVSNNHSKFNKDTKLVEFLLRVVQETLGDYGTPGGPTSADADAKIYEKMLNQGHNFVLLCEVEIGVCRHKALLFKLLCDVCHLNCAVITGYSTAGRHQWNIVSISEGDYLIDATSRHFTWAKPGSLRTRGYKVLLDESLGHAEYVLFSQHLKEFLKKPEIDLKLYVYSTKGSNEEQIINFSDYLLLNILGYSHVFLLAHSMGGLISVDAYKFLMEHSTLSRDLINIKGILTFDSPFFGLDSSIVEIINVKHIKNTRILLNGSNLISGQQEVDIEVTRSSDLKGGKQLVKMTTSTETEVESLENLNDKEKFKKHFDNNVPTIEEILHYGENSQNNENNFTNLNFSAVASIAGSILSYFTPMPLEIRSKFRSKASKHVINFTEEAVHHLTFLTPLIELEEVKDNR